MKNDTSKIAMYVAIGALVAVIILQLMGRLKTEGYEGGDADNTEAELANLLAELEGDEDEEMEDDEDMEGDEDMEPAPMGEDSDDEM